MNDLLQTVLSALQYAWPFRPVESWEHGVYFVFGKRWKVVGPGRWPVVPYFMDVKAISVVPAPLGTPLQNITLGDGRWISFSAVAMARVTDAWKTFDVFDYETSTQELMSAFLADKLMDVEGARLDSDKRKRLMTAMVGWLNQKTACFGVEVSEVWFNNLLFNVKTFRLLQDTALASASWQ